MPTSRDNLYWAVIYSYIFRKWDWKLFSFIGIQTDFLFNLKASFSLYMKDSGRFWSIFYFKRLKEFMSLTEINTLKSIIFDCKFRIRVFIAAYYGWLSPIKYLHDDSLIVAVLGFSHCRCRHCQRNGNFFSLSCFEVTFSHFHGE